MISLENQSYRLHDLLPMRTHDLVDMLQTHHIMSTNLKAQRREKRRYRKIQKDMMMV